MRITIFSPSAHQTYSNIKRNDKRQPTLGPSYLLACLERAGYQVSYLDGDALDLIQGKAVLAILKTDPDMVAISLTTGLFSETKDVCQLLREAGWKGHITLGGAHPSALPEETLQMIPWADSCLIEEAETSIVQLANALSNQQDFSEIPGCAYRIKAFGENKIVLSKKHTEPPANLDDLPMPGLEYYPMERYMSPQWSGGEYVRMASMITTRGCPYQCTFCSSGAESVLKFRYHGLDRVMAEIRRLKHDYKVGYIVFNDDTFTVNRKRCLELARRMIDEDLAIPFMVTSRVNTSDPELLTTLKDAGCFMVTYGIESGSQKILNTIGKNIKLEQARKAVREAKEVGMKVVGNFMFGHWEDTIETCRETLEFATSLGCDITQFAITIPYPGTVLHRQALAANRIHPTWDYRSFGYYGNVPWTHPNISAEDLIAIQKEAYQRNPAYYLKSEAWQKHEQQKHGNTAVKEQLDVNHENYKAQDWC